MPKSRSFLPDVNVWLALASRRHVHAQRCGNWLNSLESPEIFFWTDAYLAAFARAGEFRLVTLDRAVLSLTKEALLLR